MLTRTLTALTLLLTVTTPLVANAILTRVTFTGTVDISADPNFVIGETFEATYLVDPSSTHVRFGIPGLFDEAMLGAELRVGSYTATHSTMGPDTGGVSVSDDRFGEDSIIFSASFPAWTTSSNPDLVVDWVLVTLRDSTGTVFDSVDSIPLGFSLDEFDTRDFLVEFFNSSSGEPVITGLSGRVSSVRFTPEGVVPTPSTWILVLSMILVFPIASRLGRHAIAPRLRGR